MFGVPQRSFILVPLLFNIFLGDLYFMHGGLDIANFADHNTPYTSAKNIGCYRISRASFSVSVQMIRIKPFKR